MDDASLVQRMTAKHKTHKEDKLSLVLFLESLRSASTKDAYARDVVRFLAFLHIQGLQDVRSLGADVSPHLKAYLSNLKPTISRATFHRVESAIVSFLNFVDVVPLIDRAKRPNSFYANNKRVAHPAVIDRLIERPDVSLRTKVVLCFLSHEGYSASELSTLTLGETHERVADLSDVTLRIVADYVSKELRGATQGKRKLIAYYANSGVSRQAIWKCVKQYNLFPRIITQTYVIRKYMMGVDPVCIADGAELDILTVERIIRTFAAAFEKGKNIARPH